MRVITGQFKGRRLITPNDRSIRPATDRVKQAVFDALCSRLVFENARILDLFAGTGSLGLEALSRGAGSCVFVDSGANAVSCIEQNLAALDCSLRAKVIRSDAMRFVDTCRERFHLIFADPPYAFPETASIPGWITRNNLLEPQGYLLIEHTKSLIFEKNPSLTCKLVKKFGTTCVSFFVHHEP